MTNKDILNFIIWRPNKTHSTTAPVSLPAVQMVYSSPPTTSYYILIPKNAGIARCFQASKVCILTPKNAGIATCFQASLDIFKVHIGSCSSAVSQWRSKYGVLKVHWLKRLFRLSNLVLQKATVNLLSRV